jgi:hypothetical protein
MKLTWHIVQKDLRRYWPGLLSLSGIIVLKLGILAGAWHLPLEATRDWQLDRYEGLLLGAQLLLTFLLAVIVVQEDPIPDSAAFWRTLPISPARLLAAKLAGLLLIGVVPAVLILLAGWVGFGLPLAQLGRPLLAMAQVQTEICLVALAFGSLTKNTAHLVYWLAGLVLGVVVPTIILKPFLRKMTLVGEGTRVTHATLLNLVVLIAVVAITVNQYRSQARRRSIALLVAGVLVCFCLEETENSRLALDFSAVLSPAQAALDRQIAQLDAGVRRAELSNPTADGEATALLRVAVANPGPRLIARPWAYVARWPEAPPTAEYTFARIYQARTDPGRQFVAQAFGFATSGARELTFGAEFPLRADEVARLDGRSSPYQEQIQLMIRSATIDGQAPLAPGAILRAGDGQTEILRASADGTAIQIEIQSREAGFGSGFDWLTDRLTDGSGLAVQPFNVSYALVNPKTQTVLLPIRGSVGVAAYSYGIKLSHSKIEFSTPPAAETGSDLSDWLLVQVRTSQPRYSVKTLQENVTFKEVPILEREPSWIN